MVYFEGEGLGQLFSCGSVSTSYSGVDSPVAVYSCVSLVETTRYGMILTQ